ncbi:MAG TPA: VOC family protein [Chitinophagaceae bacterium]|jgi:catechol 2,3-dioxygenase-like lactoylglutathione lyase family enzyme
MNNTADFRIKKMSPQFIVTDLDRSIEFYTRQLGFELDFRYQDFYAGIIKDGYSIHFKLGQPSPDEKQKRRNNEDLDIIFLIDDIENSYKEISLRAIEIIQPLRDAPYGKEFYIADPDGYSLGFVAEN